MFFTMVPLGTTQFGFPIQCTNASRTPSAPDSAPTWRIYQAGGDSAILTGTAPSSDIDGTATGLRMVTNITISAGTGFASGSTYVIRAAYAVSAVNEVDIGTFVVT